MHFNINRIHSLGKRQQRLAFPIFLIISLLLIDRLFAQEIIPEKVEDHIEYEHQIEFDPSQQSRVWESAKEFSSQLKYPDKIDNKPVIDELSRTIRAKFGFYLYNKSAFLKQVDGAVFANINIVIEGNRLVSTVRNVYFIDYRRDRYGKFSPGSSKKYTLEYLRKTRNNSTWKDHFISIDENMTLLQSNIEKYVLEIKEVSNK